MSAERRAAPAARPVSDVERQVNRYATPPKAPAKTPGPKLVPLSIRVLPDLRTEFQVACKKKGRTYQDVAGEIIEKWTADNR